MKPGEGNGRAHNATVVAISNPGVRPAKASGRAHDATVRIEENEQPTSVQADCTQEE